jgi:hypothetical protein
MHPGKLGSLLYVIVFAAQFSVKLTAACKGRIEVAKSTTATPHQGDNRINANLPEGEVREPVSDSCPQLA